MLSKFVFNKCDDSYIVIGKTHLNDNIHAENPIIKFKVMPELNWNIKAAVPTPLNRFEVIKSAIIDMKNVHHNFVAVELLNSTHGINFIQVARIKHNAWTVEIQFNKPHIYLRKHDGINHFYTRTFTQYGIIVNDVEQVCNIFEDVLCKGVNPNLSSWYDITKYIIRKENYF